MCDRTDTKYNRFSPQYEGTLRSSGPIVALLVAFVLVVFGSGRTVDARTLPIGQSVSAASDGWTSGLYYWLGLWARFMQCGSPYGDQPAAWLDDFNRCYAERGIPQNLTEAVRHEMLSTLDGLQAHLLGNPGEVDQQLVERSLGTIEQARAALSAPVPVPVPAPSLDINTSFQLRNGRQS